MFGPESQVTAAFAECLAAVERVSRAMHMISGAHEEWDLLPYSEDAKAGAEQTAEALDRFVAAAHAEVGLR
jgi:hypothetical protein